mmetsp:Transcript_20165/g.20267  ORF Transcript_20165/g.20267 Transcript_20165/m.20267 type:complete len:251 (+) Transcript_20165:167-919(+)
MFFSVFYKAIQFCLSGNEEYIDEVGHNDGIINSNQSETKTRERKLSIRPRVSSVSLTGKLKRHSVHRKRAGSATSSADKSEASLEEEVHQIVETEKLLLEQQEERKREEEKEAAILAKQISEDNDDEWAEGRLLTAFEDVMAHGLCLILHTPKGPQHVKLSVVDNEIRWKKTGWRLLRKQHAVPLNSVKSVQPGKDAGNFLTHTAANASDESCFSIITETISIDLEAYGKVERDALLYGFAFKSREIIFS